jgi:alanine dehydrogenase
MSKIAAEISVDAAAHYLRKENGGKGKLLRNATAIVLGCEGTLGKTASELLVDRGAYVIAFDTPKKIPCVNIMPGRWEKRCFSKEWLTASLKTADIVICAAAAKGCGAPKLITREMLKMMQPGSVIVDPSIDEGGCAETSRPTTHDNPVFAEEGIIHYCVSNMPGAVPRSSTPALVKETLPFILEVANKGWEKALEENPILAQAAKLD